MMIEDDWACNKCTGINPKNTLSCWNCKTTFQQSREIATGAISKKQLELAKSSQIAELDRLIKSMPVVSIDPLGSIPVGKYKIKGMVSAQVIKSTGFLLEISGMDGILDGIGLDFSNTKRTAAGEVEVMNILRARAHAVGANAVIGVDLDFSDAGGFKSILICGQGTAIFIDDIDNYFDIKN